MTQYLAVMCAFHSDQRKEQKSKTLKDKETDTLLVSLFRQEQRDMF